MRALRMVKWQTQPQLRDVDIPVPGPGEVLVKVQATGLCHSDLHVMDWPEGTLRWKLPVTLGHETAGTVASLGAGARGIAEGEPVLVYGPWGCGSMPTVREGRGQPLRPASWRLRARLRRRARGIRGGTVATVPRTPG